MRNYDTFIIPLLFSVFKVISRHHCAYVTVTHYVSSETSKDAKSSSGKSLQMCSSTLNANACYFGAIFPIANPSSRPAVSRCTFRSESEHRASRLSDKTHKRHGACESVETVLVMKIRSILSASIYINVAFNRLTEVAFGANDRFFQFAVRPE